MLTWRILGVLVASPLLVFTVSVSGAADEPADRLTGWRVNLGSGEVSSFAEVRESGEPRAIGVVISAGALAGLPTELSDRHHCADRNGDGVITRPAECSDTHEFVIPLPDAVALRGDVPFKWVLLNWNPVGHIPPGIYDVPHFDIHFYMMPIADVFAIGEGFCGPEFVDCDDFEAGKMALPAGHMNSDFNDVDAVVPAMGNHLIDVTGSEFQGEPFTRSWIFGVFRGRVTFYEEMVTVAHLQSRPNGCNSIKAPQAVAVSGFYPSQSCIRYDAGTNEYVVSLEGFAYRQAR